MTDMRKKFDELKKKKQVSDEQASKPKTDDRLIKFVPGNTYRFRLLFSTSEKRQSPFIEKVTHNFYSKEKRRSGWITCPTSEYIDGKYGYKNCQACSKVSDFWKQKEKGSISAGELYNTFKRKNVCFAPVYVVSDPINPDNNGKVKIMKYGYMVYEFLEREVFARDPKTKKPIVDTETTGPDAFELKDGYDLIVTVTQKTKDFPAYTCSWSKKTSSIPLTEEDAEKSIKAIKFDEDFLTYSSKADIEKFVSDFIVKEEIAHDVEDVAEEEEDTTAEDTTEEVEDDIPYTAPTPPTPKKEEEKEVKVEKVELPPPAPKKEEKKAAPPAADDDLDIDALLKQVDENYNN